jgi:hypothetical protein
MADRPFVERVDAPGGNVVVAGHVGTLVMPSDRQPPSLRPAPVRQLPRAFPALLDRTGELAEAMAAIKAASPVQFFGQPGLGKTVLVRNVAHHTVTAGFPDGAVCLPGHRVPLEDLLQAFYDLFYDRESSYKPTDAQVWLGLQEIRALVLVDDVDLPRDAVERLMDAAPGCTFLLTSTERLLWGEGKALGLKGLPVDAALALLEEELGRPLAAEEKQAAQSLHAALSGHPLRLKQAASMVRESGRPLTAIARELEVEAALPAETLGAQILASLSESEKQVLGALAAHGCASIEVDHVPALSQIDDPAPILEALERRRLVESHSPQYSLTGSLDLDLERSLDLTPWRERAVGYFTGHAERGRETPVPEQVEVDPILHLHAWAAETGRWRDVLDLGRAVDGALVLSGRWGAWATVLDRSLRAAQLLGDRAAEAWSLHQLGTRALCLEDSSTARTLLSRALALRESLGDVEGAEATRHNLSLLPPPSPPDGPPSEPPPIPPSPVRRPVLMAAIALVAALIVASVLRTWPVKVPDPESTMQPSATVVATLGPGTRTSAPATALMPKPSNHAPGTGSSGTPPAKPGGGSPRPASTPSPTSTPPRPQPPR